MSDAITAARPGKPLAPVPAPTPTPAKPAQTLRDVKQKTLPPSGLHPLGFGAVEILTVTVAGDWTFEELLKPVAWTSVAPKLARNALNTQPDRIGSLILVNSDAGFLAWLRINAVIRDHMGGPSGLDVMCIGPSFDLKTGKAAPLDIKTGLAWVDPVRAEAAA